MVLTGSMDLSQDYDSNVFNTDNARTDEWNSVVRPDLSLASLGESDQLTISYTLEFTYNHRRDTDAMLHDLTLAAERALSSHWQISIDDAYDYSDNPVFEADITLTLEQQFLRSDDATQAEVVRLLFPEITWAPEQMTFVLSQLSKRYTEAPSSVVNAIDDLLRPGNDERQRYFFNDLSFSSVYEFAQDSQLTLGYAINLMDNRTRVQADRSL